MVISYIQRMLSWTDEDLKLHTISLLRRELGPSQLWKASGVEDAALAKLDLRSHRALDRASEVRAY